MTTIITDPARPDMTQEHIPLDTSIPFRDAIYEARRMARLTRVTVIVQNERGITIAAFGPISASQERGPAETCVTWTPGWLRETHAKSLRYCAEDRPRRDVRLRSVKRLRTCAEYRTWPASWVRLP